MFLTYKIWSFKGALIDLFGYLVAEKSFLQRTAQIITHKKTVFNLFSQMKERRNWINLLFSRKAKTNYYLKNYEMDQKALFYFYK